VGGPYSLKPIKLALGFEALPSYARFRINFFALLQRIRNHRLGYHPNFIRLLAFLG
jgi:hypothetical protein